MGERGSKDKADGDNTGTGKRIFSNLRNTTHTIVPTSHCQKTHAYKNNTFFHIFIERSINKDEIQPWNVTLWTKYPFNVKKQQHKNKAT